MTDDDPPRASPWRRLQPVVTVVGFAGIALAVRHASEDIDARLLPRLPAIALAFLVATVSLAAAGRAWVALLDVRADGARVLGAFYTSQLTKYLPAGGVVQAVGQATLSTGTSVPLRRSAAALPVFFAIAVAAGLALSAVLATSSELPAWLRALALAGPLSLLLTRRVVFVWVYERARTTIRRLPTSDVVPAQAAIDRGTGWVFLNLVTYAITFTVLLRDIAVDVPLWHTAGAAVAAWVLGFLVLPLPSGLGVREAVLVGVLPGVPTATLLAASLSHRFVAMAAEVTLTVANRLHQRSAPRASTGGGPGTAS